jgi:hypothetical protein
VEMVFVITAQENLVCLVLLIASNVFDSAIITLPGYLQGFIVDYSTQTSLIKTTIEPTISLNQINATLTTTQQNNGIWMLWSTRFR